MVDVDKLSDAEIRTKLLEFGFPVMPITGTTRKVMVKKLKLLLENKDRKVGSSEGRRSLGRYSSEEESDNEAKRIKKDKNRRATMAAPISQAPKTAKKIVEPEVASSSPNRQIRNATVTTTTRTQRIVRTSQDEFDTGSDSESDIVASSRYDSAIDGDYKRSSPVKSTLSNLSDRPYSSPKSDDTLYTTVRNIYSSQTSPARHTSFGSPSLASEYAADKLNQMRNRLSLGSPGYERPSYSSLATANDQDDKAETPFLSNFTRRLSALSSSRNADLNNRNDLVKEHDTNGSSPYGPKAYLSSFRSTRREPLYDYKNGHLSGKSNFVSFAVLAGAALFFIFLAVIYLGMRSDTAIVTSGYITPACHLGDPQSKKGVNCVHEDDVKNVLNLLNVLRPELLKRAVAHRCFDPKIKPHMTEAEIVTYCQTNFGIKDAYMIKNDLRNLEIMIFFNPEWGVSVVQTESNDGDVFEENAAKNMEQVVFNNDSKITSLVIFKPDLPWRCSMYQTLSSLVKTVAAVGAIFAVLYFGDLGFKYYRRHEQRQKDEVNFLVERIIEILQNASEEPGDNFVVINHVRDMILTVKDRKEKRGSWAKAVKYINENESRIRTEVQSVQGESFEVWRWIGSASLNRSGTNHQYRPGRRIVDVRYLIEHVLKFPHAKLRFCRSDDVAIEHEVREGFFSIYLLRCSRCAKKHAVCSEEPKSELLDVNLATVAGIVSLGLSLYQLNELCSAIHVPPVTGEEYEQYLDELHQIYDATRTTSTEGSFTCVRSSTPIDKTDGSSAEAKREKFLTELGKDVDRIEIMTRGQTDNDLWAVERRKRLTASNFGRIYKMRDATGREAIVKELLGSGFVGNVYTRYGRDNEAVALNDFQMATGKTVSPCGLFVHKDYPFLAGSPDGKVDGEDALVEVKCPYKARDSTVEEGVARGDIRFVTWNDRRLTLNRDDKYYYQVQGQLFVTGMAGCYFVVWTPKAVAYEYIEADRDCWNQMLPKLKAFYFDHLLPAILSEV